MPRFPRWLLEGHVPAFNTSLPKEHNAAWELLRTGQPAAFVRSALVAALVERWSLSYLVRIPALCMLCKLSTNRLADPTAIWPRIADSSVPCAG